MNSQIKNHQSDNKMIDQNQVIEAPGNRQSPININPALAIPAPEMAALTFTNYDIVFPQTITNNGHTVVLQLQSNERNDAFPSISDGGLNGTFIFQQLHFHWGRDSSSGSEHIINNIRYLGELHMVHYNSKYGSFSEAIKHPDGLAVIAILMENSKRDNVAFRHIEQFEKIIRTDKKNVTFLGKPIALEDLLPDETGSFYRYFGSLTTPAYNESVTWTVFDTPIAVSERQMNKFRALFNEEGRPLEDNFRAAQSLHDRLVNYRSIQKN